MKEKREERTNTVMALIQCPNKYPEIHYYDDAKYTACPICSGLKQGEAGDDAEDNLDITVSAKRPGISTVRTYNNPEKDPLDVTVSIHRKKVGSVSFSLPVGWLVCVDGPEMGREYRLVSGRNFAGQSEKMDICLSGDTTIQQEDQFSVVFDPETLTFSIIPGAGTATKLNGDNILEAKRLVDWDRIRTGNTTLVLRTFCGREFHW